jgi:hypothetical protein
MASDSNVGSLFSGLDLRLCLSGFSPTTKYDACPVVAFLLFAHVYVLVHVECALRAAGADLAGGDR